jgi:hypothetical protein
VRSVPIVRRQHLRSSVGEMENKTPQISMFGSASRSRSRRFVISPWIGIFVRLKPQCANACGYLFAARIMPCCEHALDEAPQLCILRTRLKVPNIAGMGRLVKQLWRGAGG